MVHATFKDRTPAARGRSRWPSAERGEHSRAGFTDQPSRVLASRVWTLVSGALSLSVCRVRATASRDRDRAVPCPAVP